MLKQQKLKAHNFAINKLVCEGFDSKIYLAQYYSGLAEGSATQQNCIQDYTIFTIFTKITPGLYWDYTRFAQGLHTYL